MKTTTPLILLGLLAGSLLSAFPEVNKYRIERDFKQGALGFDRISASMAAELYTLESDELRRRAADMGAIINLEGAYDEALKLVDELLSKRDLRADLIASYLLFETSSRLIGSSYGLNDEIRHFPDEICAKAVELLDHSNPFVQATAEWMLSERVKQQDGSTRKLGEMFQTGAVGAPWYEQWKSRDPRLDLRDDYCRQVIQLGQHFTIEGMSAAVDAVSERMTKLARDPATRQGAATPDYMPALENARASLAGGNLEAAHWSYLQLRKTARDQIIAARPDFPGEGVVFYTNPRITGGVWNVNVPVIGRTNMPVGDLFLKTSADPADPAKPLDVAAKIGDGSIRGIDLNWESDKIVLSWWHQEIDGSPPFGWNVNQNACLYELDLRTGAIQQLTNEPGYNDIEPAFLPDGGYVFASDRSSYGNQCAGPILQNKRCTTLFRVDPRRADRPVALSNNKDFDRHPHVLNDGTIAFMHWEYQERGLYHSHNVWRCRPDGTNMDAYYKQHISTPMSIRDVRQVPGSVLHVATAQGHHDAHNGPIILFNPSLGINNEEAMWNLTPGVSDIEGGFGPLAHQIVPEGGVLNGGGSYINPFPMSDKAFLAGNDMTGNEVEFNLYYVDVWGNRELIHRDQDGSCFMPYALRQRQRPPVVADMIDPQANFATAFLEDVYRDLPGVERGEVKYLRMSQALMLPAPVYQKGDDTWDYNHLHYLPGDATMRHFGHWVWAPRRTIGIVDVEPDGSAFFKVPAGTPVYLQALDENFCEVRRMRTSFTLQRGEFRSCTGCHETRLETVGNRKPMPRQLLAKGPQQPKPEPWGDRTVLDFEKHIQPIFDKNCVECHGERNPEAGLDFTARKIGGFNQSYRTVFGLKPEDPTPVKTLKWHLVLNPDAKEDAYIENRDAVKIFEKMQANKWPGQLVAISDRMGDASISPVLEFGSNRSKLIQTLLEHPDHEFAREEMGEDAWRTLVAWVDYNAYYHGSLFDVRNFNETGTFPRVPYNLPDVWKEPADLNPTFYNRADNSDHESMAQH